MADIYDATRALPEGEMRLLLEAIRTSMGHGRTILDVAVGTGRFARPLLDMGFEVVGVDISPRMMGKAREKGVTDLLFADVQRVPFQDGSFDAALIVHLLHLVDDWAAVVREAARVARNAVLSVAESRDGINLRARYREMRIGMGHPVSRFDEGEQGLRRMVAPSSVIEVVRTTRELDADKEIDHLRQRGQSITWGVPEDVHRKIIEELQASYGGRTLHARGIIELLVWSPEQLAAVGVKAADRGSSAAPSPSQR